MAEPFPTTASESFHAVILAAGSGSRIGGDTPKQFREIAGKPLLRHSLEAFRACPGLQSIVVVAPVGQLNYVNDVAGEKVAISGGATRQESVRAALTALSHLPKDAIILIHDAARPCILQAQIVAVADAAARHNAATLAIPVADSLRRVAGDGDAAEFVSRDSLWRVQTPQGFRFGLLADAHARGQDGATDDTALVSADGVPVKLVPGSESNIKVTMPDDFAIAEAILQQRQTLTPRVGMGFDVHAFDHSPSTKPLVLCGVIIPHARPLAGHSDADVGLHALTDALFGALGDGDIGTHFPPSDPAFKNMDSAVFLRKACDLVQQGGGRISHVDITLICEEPKITPHRAAMLARLSALLALDKSRIGLKATTTEKLGFTGRGEGIAAQAVATILWPEG